MLNFRFRRFKVFLLLLGASSLAPAASSAARAAPATTAAAAKREPDVVYTRQDLKPFWTDGCTRWPEGDPWEKNKWLHCCYAHDRRYYGGGTAGEKWLADRDLARCVTRATGNAALGWTMYLGVRAGGAPAKKSSWTRWGFGWRLAGRAYGALNTLEKLWVGQELAAYNCVAGMREFTRDLDVIDRVCGR